MTTEDRVRQLTLMIVAWLKSQGHDDAAIRCAVHRQYEEAITEPFSELRIVERLVGGTLEATVSPDDLFKTFLRVGEMAITNLPPAAKWRFRNIVDQALSAGLNNPECTMHGSSWTL